MLNCFILVVYVYVLGLYEFLFLNRFNRMVMWFQKETCLEEM